MLQLPLNTLHIVPMTPQDMERVIEIENLSYPSPWPESAFLAELAKGEVCYYRVAKFDGKIIGYCGVWVLIDEGHITTLAVHPDFRRLGIASYLLFNVFDEAVRRKLCTITLEVRISNAAAKNMYRKFGFSQAGFRRGYYLDNNEDAEIWTSQDLREPSYVQFMENLKQQIRSTHAIDVHV